MSKKNGKRKVGSGGGKEVKRTEMKINMGGERNKVKIGK